MTNDYVEMNIDEYFSKSKVQKAMFFEHCIKKFKNTAIIPFLYSATLTIIHSELIKA